MKNVVENRRVERFDLDLEAFVYVSDDSDQPNSLTMQSRDVSSDGVYLMTENPLPVGTKLKVDMILSLDEIKKIGGKALIKSSGEVLRTESGGMAICFDSNSKIVPFSSKKQISSKV